MLYITLFFYFYSMKKILFGIIVLSILSACNSNSSKPNTETSTNKMLSDSALENRLINKDIDSVTLDSLKKHKTILKFEKELFDYGTIEEGTVLKEKITYKNVGENPLIIIAAFGSCGCTVPTFSRKPLLPGETDTLYFSFDSNGRSGNQSKSINVLANTEKPVNLVKFTVKVK